MKPLKLLLLALSGLLLMSARPVTTPLTHGRGLSHYLIPQPLVAKQTGSFYQFDAINPIYNAKNNALKEIAEGLSKRLIISSETEQYIDFRMELVKDTSLGEEGYRLKVGDDQIQITAQKPAGIFYGVQTFYQLLGGSPMLSKEQQERYNPKMYSYHEIEILEIVDKPRFPWRGLMLDVSRHWFTKEEVKEYIDQMATLKFNRFHWHLTDDQGWRVQIDALPLLTEKGSMRAKRVGDWWTREPQREGEATPYGGFYTKADIAEVLEYARQRHITVVPEVDVPGHMLAAIVAYPDLACFPDEAPKHVNVGNKFYTIDQNTICIGNPKTMQYMEKIFAELAEMFPSEYIHIGADEAWKGFWQKCPKCQALMAKENLKDVNELQSYFVRQMEQLLKKHGKKLIGWDEIHEGGLAPEATVMSWRGMQGGIDAAKQGHHVIMTPNQHCYLDLYQGEPTVEPNTYSMARLTDSYNWDPVPEGIDPEMILGGQGNLWAESLPTFRHVEYMTWPRGWALSEVFWSDPARKDWMHFVHRVDNWMNRLDNVPAEGVKYARSMFNAIVTSEVDSLGNLQVMLGTELPFMLDIYYTFDNTIPDPYNGHKYQLYDAKPIPIPPNASRITVQTYSFISRPGERLRERRQKEPAGQIIRLDIEELRSRAKKVDRVIGNLDL